MLKHALRNSKTLKETLSSYLMDINSSASPKSKTEKGNNNNARSKGTALTADNQDTWRVTVGNKRRQKYHI